MVPYVAKVPFVVSQPTAFAYEGWLTVRSRPRLERESREPRAFYFSGFRLCALAGPRGLRWANVQS